MSNCRLELSQFESGRARLTLLFLIELKSSASGTALVPKTYPFLKFNFPNAQCQFATVKNALVYLGLGYASNNSEVYSKFALFLIVFPFFLVFVFLAFRFEISNWIGKLIFILIHLPINPTVLFGWWVKLRCTLTY